MVVGRCSIFEQQKMTVVQDGASSAHSAVTSIARGSSVVQSEDSRCTWVIKCHCAMRDIVCVQDGQNPLAHMAGVVGLGGVDSTVRRRLQSHLKYLVAGYKFPCVDIT